MPVGFPRAAVAKDQPRLCLQYGTVQLVYYDQRGKEFTFFVSRTSSRQNIDGAGKMNENRRA